MSGQGGDRVEFALDVPVCHPEDSAIEEAISSSAQLGMKPCAYFQVAGHPPGNLDLAPRGFGDAAQNFEQGGLARAIPPDDADSVALLDFERDVFQRPEFHLIALHDLPPRSLSRVFRARLRALRVNASRSVV